jgi:hypothetical protein
MRLLLSLFLALIILLFVGSCVWTKWPHTVGPLTIVKTERVPEVGYMVFTNGETMVNQDSWLFFKFNSSDLYGRMNAGQVCTFRVNGWRMPLFSWYRNILSAECGPA